MAFDTVVADQITAMVLTGSKSGSELNATVDRNLVQGLGVVSTAMIQQSGSVSDDAGLIAALQTASRVPQQGQTPAA